MAVSASDLLELDDEAQLHLLRNAMVAAGLLPSGAEISQIRGLVNVFRANSQAHYHPGEAIPVPIKLLRASETHRQFDFSSAEDPGVPAAQSTLGWKHLTTHGVAVHPVPGNHLTMLRAPHVDRLCQVLRTCLTHREVELLLSESD